MKFIAPSVAAFTYLSQFVWFENFAGIYVYLLLRTETCALEGWAQKREWWLGDVGKGSVSRGMVLDWWIWRWNIRFRRGKESEERRPKIETRNQCIPNQRWLDLSPAPRAQWNTYIYGWCVACGCGIVRNERCRSRGALLEIEIKFIWIAFGTLMWPLFNNVAMSFSFWKFSN